MLDFLSHREQIEACFKFCLDAYASRFGSLQAALASCKGGDERTPFNADFRKEKWYPGSFSEVAERYGVANVLAKWVGSYQSTFDIRVLSAYFTNVTFAGQAYICNFTLQRKEEVGSLRNSCLEWEHDEKLGRVPIICGETTKTDPDSDARWVASPSVEIAIQALSVIAELRMICDRANPLTQPMLTDQADPYLLSAATEPWAGGIGRLYNIRSPIRSIRETLKRFTPLLDSEEMRITSEDLKVAQRLTPNLPTDEFCVGKIWPLAWHQYRRTGCVNMFASGDISDSTIQQQMKHASRLMPYYYGRNHSRLHFNKQVQTAVIMAMYQAQATIAKIAVTGDRFISPHSPEYKAALAVNVLSAKNVAALTAMAKKGTVAFREHRLGGCMKVGVCEYGGIESIARCAGGDGGKSCKDVLYDRLKEPLVRIELRRITEEIELLPFGHPRYHALTDERCAMENYLNAVSINPA